MQIITIFCDSCGREIRSLIDQAEVRTWIRERKLQLDESDEMTDFCPACKERMEKPEEEQTVDLGKSHERAVETWKRLYGTDNTEATKMEEAEE